MVQSLGYHPSYKCFFRKGVFALLTHDHGLFFVDDGSDENERLELRSRTEVRVSAGETEESVVYQFAGKTARD